MHPWQAEHCSTLDSVVSLMLPAKYLQLLLAECSSMPDTGESCSFYIGQGTESVGARCRCALSSRSPQNCPPPRCCSSSTQTSSIPGAMTSACRQAILHTHVPAERRLLGSRCQCSRISKQPCSLVRECTSSSIISHTLGVFAGPQHRH